MPFGSSQLLATRAERLHELEFKELRRIPLRFSNI
jgi:hypothetical protein